MSRSGFIFSMDWEKCSVSTVVSVAVAYFKVATMLFCNMILLFAFQEAQCNSLSMRLPYDEKVVEVMHDF